MMELNENQSKQRTKLVSPEILSLEILKYVYDAINTKSNDIINDYLVSCLENTALESGNISELDELLQRKRWAFECLRLISFDFSEDFCLIFYESITMTLRLYNQALIENSGLNNLDKFMNSPTPLREKLLLLQTFTTCLCESAVNFSVFQQFSADSWRRKLLLQAMLTISNGRDFETIESITMLIEQLAEFLAIHGFEWSVDDVLEKLVSCQKKYSLNTQFATEVLMTLPVRPEIYYLLGQDEASVYRKINEAKYITLLTHSEFVEFLSENYFDTLQLILTFPLPIALSIVTKINGDNFEQIITFVEMLKCCEIEQGKLNDFLFNLDFENSIDTLKDKLLFQIVKSIINTYFPCYNSYVSDQLVQPVHHIKTRELSLTCGCFDPLEKCPLHNTPECCNLLHALHCAIAKVFIPKMSSTIPMMVDTIRSIVENITSATKITELINALETLDEYNMDLSETELRNIFLDFLTDGFERRIHKAVVKRSFPGTYEKSVQELFEDIESYNTGITPHIIELFFEVRNTYENRSCFFPDSGSISSWREGQIKLWAVLVRGSCVTDAEKLAVLLRAVSITVNLCVRDIQLLAVIMMIKTNIGKGRLCQVNTGEGKTLVIAIAAAFQVLSGRKVDIYTSSPLLAVPQSLEFRDMFDVCEISVTNNVAPNSKYDCDIIYGTNTSFQRDVLSDEFRKSDVRRKRKFDVVIVDEVDNMLIDGNNWILKLSCDMPAMDHLESLLAAIYIQVKRVASGLIEKNGEVYFREEDEIFDDEGNVKQEVKFRDIPIVGSKRDFIMKCTECHIRKLIRDEHVEVENNYPEIKIPKHLRTVISRKHIKNWIESAINSIFDYAQDEDYVLNEGKITIVDANNTGVLKKNAQWSNGLHQFLQIKHGCKVDPENFTSNFISNVAIFSRYSSIFGLTGTLGSDDTRKFLHETYDVDSVVIPPFKLKQHKVLKPLILNNTKSWYFEIARNCLQKLQNGRAVLIIMKFIKETEELASVFQQHFNYKHSKIRLYKTDDNAHVVESPMNPGDIIITTNIAGRGTDIKLNKSIEKNGGLHVCVTFLPINSRVEDQNIGRTSRQGNSGTSQLILYVPGNNSASINDLKETRLYKEKSNIKAATKTVTNIKIKDKIFRRFCDLLNEIQGRNAFVKKIELKSVEERFAIWLTIHEHAFDEYDSKTLEKYEEFRQFIQEDDRRGTLIQNPYFHVELGNNYLEKNEFEQAIFEYSKAINLDENFAENAYYNRAWAYLKLYGDNVSGNKYFISKAVCDFKSARKSIQTKEYGLHLMQTASRNEVFSEQVSNKLNLYNLQKNVIEMAIGPDTDALDAQLKEIENHLKIAEDSVTKTKLAEISSKLREDKENIGVIGRAMQNNRDLKIESEDFIPEAERSKLKNEIEEFERNGWLPGFKITEVKPIDWVSVISLLGIGLAQLIIGAAITVFTLGTGASIGIGFMSEGVSDIIAAVKDGIINRDFDWATWALMKVVSIAVSIVCAGFKAIKDVAKTAYSGVKNIATAGIKAFNKATTEGFKIAAKKLGFELSKGVAKEIVTDLVNYGIDKSLIPKLEEAIIELVRVPIEENLRNNSKVKCMLKLDQKNKNHDFENQIRSKGHSLLIDKGTNTLKALCLHTVSCVTGNLGLGTVHKICTILKGSADFSKFTYDFINDFNKEINEIEFEDEEASTSRSNDNESKSEKSQETVNCSKAGNRDKDIDLNKVGQPAEQVQQNRRQCTPSDLSYDFAGMVSTRMIQIMKGSIVSPITQMAVSYSVDGLCSKVNKSLETQTERFRAAKRVCDNNNRNFENITGDDDTPQTSQGEFDEVGTLIDRVETGGPVGLVHLGALSKAAGAPIEVYDADGALMFPVRHDQGGEPIKLQYHCNENDVGHFTLLGKNEPFLTGTGVNMCAFNCVAQQCNKDPNQLKADTVNILKHNRRVLAARLDDIKMLETSQHSVFGLKGGAVYYGKNYLDAVQYISSSEGKFGFDNNKPGHPEIHISYKGDPRVRLAMVSDVIKQKIIVKGKKNKVMFTTGSQYGGDPIIFQFNEDKKDPEKSYFSEPGGTDKLFFNHNHDSNFYSFLGKKTNKTPESIKKQTNFKLDNLKVPQSVTCVENKPPTSRPPTGFFSKEDEAFVLDHVLKSEVVERKLRQMNRYKPGVRDGKNFIKIPLTIPVEDLNLPREVSAGQWLGGKLICEFPVKTVFVLLQHYSGQESNPKAQVQIQTIYPPH